MSSSKTSKHKLNFSHSQSSSPSISNGGGSGKKQSANAFAVVQCKHCSAELLAADLDKHSTSSLCRKQDEKSESKLSQEEQKNLFTLIAEDHGDWLDTPILVEGTVLYTSSVVLLNKTSSTSSSVSDSTKNALKEVLYIHPTLLDHIHAKSGQFVTVCSLSNITTITKKHTLTLSTSDGLKNIFSVGLSKETRLSPNCTFQINFRLKQVPIHSMIVTIKRKFTDPFQYLSVVSQVKKCLQQHSLNPEMDQELLCKLSKEEKEQSVWISRVQPSKCLEAQLSGMSLYESATTLSTQTPVHVITEETRMIFNSEPCLFSKRDSSKKLIGYAPQMATLRKLIHQPLVSDQPALLLPRTILLTGPSGAGKSLAIQTLHSELSNQVNFIIFSSSLFLSKSFEFDRFRSAFNACIQIKPSVLVLDNLEDISCEKNQMEKKLVAWLKVLLDDLPKSDHVLVIGATNKPEQLDSSLRRPGRFDLELDFPVPSPGDRKLILAEVLRVGGGYSSELSAKEIDDLADGAHGFTGADLVHLVEMTLLARVDETKQTLPLTHAHLAQTLRSLKPSVMREIILEKPKVSWDEIGGLQELRHLLQETVVWPIKHPDAFHRLGIDPPRGILMYGPPGCCKTQIGRALASESGLNFFSIKGPELFSKWVGESERAIRDIFAKARAASPSILFFDEIDALAAERGQSQSAVGDRVLAQLLTEIDGVERLSQVVIIAATNRPDIVDRALLRPGRLDSMVYVPMPNLATRKEIFTIRLKAMPVEGGHQNAGELIDHLAQQSQGYTGAEITAVCQRAGLIALSESLEASTVNREHFRLAFERVRPRIPEQMVQFYESFSTKCNEMKQ